MAKNFDLAAALADVSDLDTSKGREQIVYIDLELLDEDERNFYSTDGIEELAESIEFLGLQQPLRVHANPDRAGRYIITSGHRRRLAIQMIVDAGNAEFRQVACIIEQTAASPAMQELRLIYANSDTRKMTPADLSKQADRVEALLYKLKKQGVEFPGRMRDHVAEVCKISQSKLARLKVIRERLYPELKTLWDEGKLNEAKAYRFAQAPVRVQRAIVEHVSQKRIVNAVEYAIARWLEDATTIMTRSCPKDGKPCVYYSSLLAMRFKEPDYWSPCVSKCCCECGAVIDCQYAKCPYSEEAKEAERENQAQREQTRAERAAAYERQRKERAAADTAAWQRVQKAADAAGVNDEGLLLLLGREPDDDCVQEMQKRIAGTWPANKYGCLEDAPYDAFDFDEFVDLAEKLNVSTDYLLGRTDDLQMPQPAESKPAQLPDGAITWKSGLPDQTGDVFAVLQNGAVIQTRRCYYDTVAQAFYFHANGQQIDGITCLGWLPAETEK